MSRPKLSKSLNVFIGYDERESIAWHTMAHSVFKYSSQPVAIHPVNLENLSGHYLREHDPRQSNAFSFSRFLVPHLMDFQDDAIFFDCDMLLTEDVYELFEIGRRNAKPVSVVKHDYVPKNDVKYLGNRQYSYPRKNWSSVIYWNCADKKNSVLSPSFVRDADAATLHRFLWLNDEDIGALPIEWNFLVGEYEVSSKLPKNIHWTIGGPYFNEYCETDYRDNWFKMRDEMLRCDQIK